MTFADELKAARAAAGLSQPKLAALLAGVPKCSRAQISLMEMGIRTPPTSAIPYLCDALGLAGAARKRFIESAHMDHATPDIDGMIADLWKDASKDAKKIASQQRQIAKLAATIHKLTAILKANGLDLQ